MKELSEKKSKVGEDVGEAILIKFTENPDLVRRDMAMKLLGGMLAVDRVHKNISSHISSEMIKALIVVQKEKLYLDYGFNRFVEFLQSSDFKLPNKTEFYSRKELLEIEGEERYEIFNDARISLSTRKLLAKRGELDITIEGDELVIGTERADLSDLPTIKHLINEFANDNKNLLEDKKRQDEKVVKLKEQIETGQKEFDQLRRSLDSKFGTPYEEALTKAVLSLNALSKEAKKLEPDLIADRGLDDVKLLWDQMLLVRRELQQDDLILTEKTRNESALSPNSFLEALTDDFGDELE